MSELTFGERLKLIRISEGIAQSKLAEALKVSVKTISHWETNYTQPSVPQLIQLANFFNLTIDELVGRNN